MTTTAPGDLGCPDGRRSKQRVAGREPGSRHNKENENKGLNPDQRNRQLHADQLNTLNSNMGHNPQDYRDAQDAWDRLMPYLVWHFQQQQEEDAVQFFQPQQGQQDMAAQQDNAVQFEIGDQQHQPDPGDEIFIEEPEQQADIEDMQQLEPAINLGWYRCGEKRLHRRGSGPLAAGL